MTLDFECPHCSCPMYDAWEYLDCGETCEAQCDACDKMFLLCQETTVTYHTHFIVDKE